MMNIIQRNLFRLLRCGVFDATEAIEPMSVHKWGKLYQLAVAYNVQPFAYSGLQKCKDQFFLRLTAEQWQQWAKVTESQMDQDDEELLRPYKLTNPILNRKLQNILDDELSDINTRRMLIQIIRIARHILNEGLPLRLLIELGQTLRQQDAKADFDTLDKWLRKLQFQQMAQLEGVLLVELLGFSAEEIPFVQDDVDKRTSLVAHELAEYSSQHQKFFLAQDPDSIFVHTSGGSALLNHIRRSARYMRFIPSEAFTNFFASFAHSLAHIEE